MATSEAYRRQVSLIVRALPLVADEECFALKGGTAINFFFRNMPRLSVDIDLVFLPVKSRKDSLEDIDAAMKRIETRLRETLGATTTRSLTEGKITRLVASLQGAQIKIELSPVLRGTAYEPELRPVAEKVEDAFGFAEIKVVSFADVYAGKLLAALDRQHPRDLFDVRDLLAAEGITDELREAFLLYLIGHNRPMHELLARTRKDLGTEYANGFVGMTEEDVPIAALTVAQNQMIDTLIGQMPARHKQFLIGFERGQTDWSLLHIPHASTLPAVLWRQQNLDSLSAERRTALVASLAKVLGVEIATGE